MSHTITYLDSTYGATFTWETLTKIADIIAATSTITSDTEEVMVRYNNTTYTIGVGDTKSITYNGTSYTARILGFNHDRLATGTGTAGISFAIENVLDVKPMRSTATNDKGWTAETSTDYVYPWLNDVSNGLHKNLEIANLGLKITSVSKGYTITHNTGAVLDSGDYMWLLSCSEIWGAKKYAPGVEGNQYKFYEKRKDQLTDTSNGYLERRDSNNSKVKWSLRSTRNGDTYRFCSINLDGGLDNWEANKANGIAPCFAIGEKKHSAVILTEKYGNTFKWSTLCGIGDEIASNPLIKNDVEEVTVTYGGTPYIIGVGDWMPIVYNGVTYYAIIIGFNHDALAGSTNKAGISFMFSNIIGKKCVRQVAGSTNGGWVSETSTDFAYPWLNDRESGIYKILENNNSGLKITSVCKEYGLEDGSGKSVSSDYMWLLSCSEIYGDKGYSTELEGNRYKFFKNTNVVYNQNAGWLEKIDSSNVVDYWRLRSVYSGASGRYCAVDTNGRSTAYERDSAIGMVPCFAVGEKKHSAAVLTEKYGNTFKWSTLCGIGDEIASNPLIKNDVEEVTVTYGGTPYIIGVGDWMPIVYNGVTYNAIIIGFNHDKLPGNMRTAGISFIFSNIIDTKCVRMSGSSTNGGWVNETSSTCAYPWLNDRESGIYNSLEKNNSGLKITAVCKEYGLENSSGKAVSGDYMWLLSSSEIWGDKGYATVIEGDRYKYFKNTNAVYNQNSGWLERKNSSNAVGYWRLRSVYSGASGRYCAVDTNGCSTAYERDSAIGMVPCFSVGEKRHTVANLKTKYSMSWELLCNIADVIAATPSITNNADEVTVIYGSTTYTIGIGDTMEIAYNGGSKSSGKYTTRIIGFNHDKLAGSNNMAGISLEFAEGIINKKMRTGYSNAGGWIAESGTECAYPYLNDSTQGLYTQLKTQNTRLNIAEVSKKYLTTHTSGSTLTSNNYMWLLACSEIWNNGNPESSNYIYGNAAASEGAQYKYYKNINASSPENSQALRKQLNGTNVTWWLRSIQYESDWRFSAVTDNGSCNSGTVPASEFSISPGFAIAGSI